MIRRTRPFALRADARVKGTIAAVTGVAILSACFVSFGHAALVLIAAAAAWHLVPWTAAAARRLKATVLPGGRSIHAQQTPLLGGLAIFFPLLAYLVLEGSPLALGLAAGSALMVAAGALDDLRGLAPRYKVAAQIGGAFLLLAAGYRVPALEFAPFGAVTATGFEILLVVAWVVLATNAFNLIDGLDGLAAAVAVLVASTCAFSGLAPGPALVLAGASLGFLRHNLPRARVFLGDTGSMLLGFVVAAVLLNGSGPMNAPLALGLLALPLGDAAISALRRWLRGKPVSSADRGHVHHLLLAVWGSPGRALCGLVAFAASQALLIGLYPNVGGLLGTGLVWLLACTYLLAKGRPAWRRILLHRRSFRRIHLVRRFAEESLRLADGPSEVFEVLDRVAQDFGLVSLRVRSVRVERTRPVEGVLVEEHVDCGETTASWSAPFVPEDPVLAEEKRTILCDLLRAADARLGLVSLTEAPASASPAPRDRAVRPLAPVRAARVHFIAEDRDRLRRVSHLVRETRRRGTLEPVVVHVGRRDALSLSAAQFRELDLPAPDVDLDVPEGDGIVFMARVMERYNALLQTAKPSVVVVGDGASSVACALAAKEAGVAVAHLAAEAAPASRTITESMADLVLSSDRRGRADEGRQLLFVQEPGAESAERIVPALEALLIAAPEP